MPYCHENNWTGTGKTVAIIMINTIIGVQYYFFIWLLSISICNSFHFTDHDILAVERNNFESFCYSFLMSQFIITFLLNNYNNPILYPLVALVHDVGGYF